MQGSAVWAAILIAAVVILVVGVTLLIIGRVRANRRTAALRQHFGGTEYKRAIKEAGSRRQGEAELEGRLRRRQELSLRHLDADERQRFMDAWESAQMSFVDTPVMGLREADLLVMQVMRDRGYPVEHFTERAKLVSVDHPDLVEHFRSAHAIAVANEEDSAGTEELRQAMVDYRYLFDELLAGGDPERTRRM